MKRLYKNDQNKLISGVCSGLAEYIGIDPSIVRIIWVVLGFTGTGIIAYIACALLLPEKTSLGL